MLPQEEHRFDWKRPAHGYRPVVYFNVEATDTYKLAFYQANGLLGRVDITVGTVHKDFVLVFSPEGQWQAGRRLPAASQLRLLALLKSS